MSTLRWLRGTYYSNLPESAHVQNTKFFGLRLASSLVYILFLCAVVLVLSVMNFLSSCLGLIVFRVCLSFASINAPPNLDTKRDYASIPGHLEPLGAKSVKHSLEVIQTYPDPKTFFKTHVVASKPVLIQNAAKLSSAFAKWTDEYFLSFPETTEHKIVAEQGKKEKRSLPSREISFSEFVKTYKEEDIYMVSSMPKFIRYVKHIFICNFPALKQPL